LKLLDDCLFEMDGNIVVRNSHQNMLHLAYHKNALIHTLSIHSAVALAALTLRSLQCTEALLIEISWLICDLLQYEFLFCKPCENLRERIKRVIEGMKNDGLLKAVEGDHLDASWNILIPDSDAECKLLFYSNLLRPFLQSIYIVLQKLIALTTPFEGKGADFVRDILSRAHSPIVTPFALLNEALNADSFSNALRLFHEKKVLAEAPTVGLANVEQANELLKTLDTFLRDSK
uniref:BcDNA.GH07066 (inferred by orthology to a D. melanogaster protein) n=1 Tax=Anisakis simplex TaxID=6269 RepID=A0A0M3J2U2_ANISI